MMTPEIRTFRFVSAETGELYHLHQMVAAALSAAFFLSGAAGLVFQVVWFHRAGLVFGSSVWAVTIVLSSFMGGLALGNALAGRYSSRLVARSDAARPLVVYAVLEAIVAISGLLVTYFLPQLSFVLRPLTQLAGNSVPVVNLVRLVAAFVILAIPATAMGATLPILVGALTSTVRSFGVALGRLYGWNTLGAVVGLLVAELALIDRLGVAGAAWTAAVFNLIAGALAFSVRDRTPQDVERRTSAQATRVKSMLEDRQVPLGALLAAAFLSGLSLLALEIIWFRFLTMYVLSTTMAASLMLAVVLGGIALGGLAASLRADRASGYSTGGLAFLSTASVLYSYSAFQPLTSGAQIADAWRILWLATVLSAPTSFVSGMFFTRLGAQLRQRIKSDTAAAALLTLTNTTGALLGPILAAFVLLPFLGMERSFLLVAAIYGVVGVLLLRVYGFVASIRQWSVAVFAVMAALAVLMFPAGTMKDKYFLRAAAPYADDGSRVVATREGRTETIFLMQQQWLGKPIYNRLVTNGFSMTGTAVPGMRYMRYFAYWPMLLHTAPLRHALLVCYGAGVTAGAVLDIPGLESLDIAEISSDIVAMSDLIYTPDRHPLRDPRARLHIEDGRYFLATSDVRFDLITGEPPPPRTPGAVNIYTREYFQLIRDHLAEGGIATYWLPVARPQPGTDVDTVLKAFCDVFDDCSLWNATPFDLMMVGTNHATGFVSDDQMRAPWQTPGLQGRLAEVGFERPEQIGATFIGDAAFIKDLLGATPPLTDDFPHRIIPTISRPSLSAPSATMDRAASGRFERVLDPVRAEQAFSSSNFIRQHWPAELIGKTRPFFMWQRVINRNFWEGGKPLAQIEDLHAVLTQSSLRTLPLWILGSDEVKEQIAEKAVPQSAETDYARGLRALSGRDYRGAADLFFKTEQQGLRAPTIRGLLVYALCLDGQLDEARQFSRGIDVQNADEKHFWDWMEKNYGLSREGGN